ncbi:MAG: polyhydroxyalkanoic acid synthase [Gammaproteobacteria bacterium]|nr:polyhydroxyalkanoic acid synthase [Gammaproteobacteria bacterium]
MQKKKPSEQNTSSNSSFFYKGEEYDYMFRSWLGQYTRWLSPASYCLAFTDWMMDLAISPAKQANIAAKAITYHYQFMQYVAQSIFDKNCAVCTHGLEYDKRFENKLWVEFPFNLYSQYFLLCEKIWTEASSDPGGMNKHHHHMVNFTGRQILDMFSPSNFPWTNPEVLQATFNEGGLNLVRGGNYLLNDIYRKYKKLPPVGTEHYQVGMNVAATKGKVVYRNNLIELIQYEPTTSTVYAEPILFIPAWIMKYYILDLSEHNSLVKYLVDKGHTVFMISWKNPDSEDRNLSMTDYINLGIFAAIDAINQIIPKQQIHAVGYCLGGTLLMMAAAYMSSTNDNRLKTITLFAAQVDFKEAGELLLFVDESQIQYLESIMWKKGYLDGKQMASTFNMLRSVDLIWSKVVREYLIGQQEDINDLMAWNYDTTRLPYKMHSQYLRKLFINNDLVQGNFKVNKSNVALHDVATPLFSVGTVKDHISPWKSVYKIHLFIKSEITFVLTSGGHNAGIVSEPGHPNRNFQILTHHRNDKYLTAKKWLETAPTFDGSWWPKWHEWLAKHSIEQFATPPIGAPEKGYPILCDAPGTYVFQR